MKDYKNMFPFKIGTTSYIFKIKKDNLVRNIEKLKKSFDFVQLLFFSKNYLSDVMGNDILNRLKEIQINYDISYIIHLPIDLDLMNPDKSSLNESVEIISEIISKTEDVLDIKNYILHIDRFNDFYYPPVELSNNNLILFDYVLDTLKNKLKKHTGKILIENTGYDLVYFKDLINKYKYSICMDIGHLFLNKIDLDLFVKNFKDQIKLIHLHGFNVLTKKDHVSLKTIKIKILNEILEFLKCYDGYLTIEVFNKCDLISSINCLNSYFKKIRCE